jgi:hypothetical protein
LFLKAFSISLIPDMIGGNRTEGAVAGTN